MDNSINQFILIALDVLNEHIRNNKMNAKNTVDEIISKMPNKIKDFDSEKPKLEYHIDKFYKALNKRRDNKMKEQFHDVISKITKTFDSKGKYALFTDDPKEKEYYNIESNLNSGELFGLALSLLGSLLFDAVDDKAFDKLCNNIQKTIDEARIERNKVKGDNHEKND